MSLEPGHGSQRYVSGAGRVANARRAPMWRVLGAYQVASGGRWNRSGPNSPVDSSRHFIPDLGDSHCLLALRTLSKVRCGSL
jgi:hypothetical protein